MKECKKTKSINQNMKLYKIKLLLLSFGGLIVIVSCYVLSYHVLRSVILPTYSKYEALQQKNISMISRNGELSYSNSYVSFKIRKQLPFYITKDKGRQFSSLEEIHNTIWKQIELLQESGNCEEKLYLRCETLHWSGLGSLLHRYSSCIQVAFALGRTFFIHQKEYDHFGGLKQWLLPESSNCGYMKDKYDSYSNRCNVKDSECYLKDSFDINNTYKVLTYWPHHPFPAPRRIPGTIPKVIESALKRLKVDDPKMWFAAQFIGYLLLRPNKSFQEHYQRISKQIKIQHPYLAMHIRHGDKLTSKEAKYIPEIKFVEKAKEYYNTTGSSVKRTIYLATDDDTVKGKLEKLFPKQYSILMCPESYRQKGLQSYDDKYFPKEVIGSMLTDLYFLIHSNFTICTYSSNIGRLVNLLNQAKYPYNNKDVITSLDDRNTMSYQMRYYMYLKSSALYIAIRSNSITGLIDDGTALLKYKAGAIFRIDGKSKSSDFISVQHGSTNGLVFSMDMIEWPGYPNYYFYEE